MVIRNIRDLVNEKKILKNDFSKIDGVSTDGRELCPYTSKLYIYTYKYTHVDYFSI